MEKWRRDMEKWRSGCGYGEAEERRRDMEERREEQRREEKRIWRSGGEEEGYGYGGLDMEYLNMLYAYNKYLPFQFSRRKFEK